MGLDLIESELIFWKEIGKAMLLLFASFGVWFSWNIMLVVLYASNIIPSGR